MSATDETKRLGPEELDKIAGGVTLPNLSGVNFAAIFQNMVQDGTLSASALAGGGYAGQPAAPEPEAAPEVPQSTASHGTNPLFGDGVPGTSATSHPASPPGPSASQSDESSGTTLPDGTIVYHVEVGSAGLAQTTPPNPFAVMLGGEQTLEITDQTLILDESGPKTPDGVFVEDPNAPESDISKIYFGWLWNVEKGPMPDTTGLDPRDEKAWRELGFQNSSDPKNFKRLDLSQLRGEPDPMVKGYGGSLYHNKSG